MNKKILLSISALALVSTSAFAQMRPTTPTTGRPAEVTRPTETRTQERARGSLNLGVGAQGVRTSSQATAMAAQFGASGAKATVVASALSSLASTYNLADLAKAVENNNSQAAVAVKSVIVELATKGQLTAEVLNGSGFKLGNFLNQHALGMLNQQNPPANLVTTLVALSEEIKAGKSTEEAMRAALAKAGLSYEDFCKQCPGACAGSI